jgi:FkbM family methyltransferase
MNTQKIKNLIIKILLFLRIKKHLKKSYSQFGEDLVLASFVNESKKGFYVDIGAYDPERFSNTNYYYKKGWNGINIDARPGSMKKFNKMRKRDINIEKGISNELNTLEYHMYKEPAYNTFSKENYKDLKEKNIIPIKIQKVQVDRLENILKNHLPSNIEIDFMSIDVEGHTMEVLESNDWSKYRSKYILVEINNTTKDNKLNNFLTEKGYDIISIANITSIYKDTR